MLKTIKKVVNKPTSISQKIFNGKIGSSSQD